MHILGIKVYNNCLLLIFQEDSSLECTKHLRFCRGRNLMLNFTDLSSRKEQLRYKMDILKEGQFGGYCR